MSATDSTLVRSSVRQTVDLFVWVYMILSHSPIHVRFSCVFFTRDWLGLEPQRQRACQQGAGKRLVFNLLRPDSIAWNCGREARSFSPDSLWIFGSRIFVPFFFYLSLSLPLSSFSTSLSIMFSHSLFFPLFSICFFPLLFSVFSWISFSFSNVHVRHLPGESQSIEIAFDFALLSRPFLYSHRATKWAHLSPSKRYSSLVHLKGLISRECRFCAGYIVSAGLPPTPRLFTHIFAPQGFNVSSRFFWTRLEKIRVWINWWINPRLFKRWFLLTFEEDA